MSFPTCLDCNTRFPSIHLMDGLCMQCLNSRRKTLERKVKILEMKLVDVSTSLVETLSLTNNVASYIEQSIKKLPVRSTESKPESDKES